METITIRKLRALKERFPVKKPGSLFWPYIALSATSILWGTTWVASKMAVQTTPGLQVSYLRQFIAGSVLLFFFLVIKKEKLPSPRQFLWLLLVAFFMFAINNGFATWAVKYIPSGLAALIGTLYPLFIVMIEFVLFKKRDYKPLTFVGLLLGLAGVLIVLYENTFQDHPEGYGFGVVICFIAMLCWCAGTILIARNKYRMNPYYAMGWQMFLASFIIFLMAVFTGQNMPLMEIETSSWLSIFYLVAAGSITAFSAFLYTLKTLPPAIASLYAYINPIVAIVLGSFIFTDEILTFNVLTGALIAVFGVYLVNLSLRKRN